MPPSSSSVASSAGGTKKACELFNSLFPDYQAVPARDANGFEEIYLQADDAKDAVRDAVFANAGACTAEGVTLRL